MTFLNPLVLFGLAAAAIPVVIHLLNLRKLRTIEFSSLRFLKELQRSSIRRIRIRQWILLALRTLLVVALVLAFSRPALRGSMAGLIGGRASTTMVVLVDDSPSMTVRNAQGMAFREARDAATHLASLLREGDQMFLLPLSRIRGGDQAAPHRSREAAAQAAAALVPSQVRVPFRDALQAAGHILAASTNPNQEIFLITDAQASQFGTDSTSGAWPDARTRAFLVRTAPGSLQNAGVTSVEVTTRILTRGRPAEVRARIRNAGSAPLTGAVASFYLDGARVMQQTVDVPAGGSTAVTGRFVPHRSGVLSGSVQIEDDELEADNRRFFTLTVPERISTLLVGSAEEDTRYVNLGLALTGDSTLSGLFAVRRTTNLSAVDLAAVDVVILCNIPEFSSDEAERLGRFVRAGGGLMIFPGDRSDIGNYNATLFPKLGVPPCGPLAGKPAGTDGGSPGARGALSFQRIDLAHPVFDGMFEQTPGKRTAAVASPHVYAALAPGIGNRGHALITLSNGAGFLVDYPSGEGRVLLAAVEAGMGWSDFPVQGLFAPLLYRSVLYLAARSQTAASFTVGQPLECAARLHDRAGDGPFLLTSPSGVEEKTVPEYRGTSALAIFHSPASAEAGVYLLHRAGSASRAGSPQPQPPPQDGRTQGAAPESVISGAAVNVDSAETDLRPADGARIERFWASLGLAPGSTGVFAAAGELNASVETSRYGVELWKHFLGLALALAMAEMAVGRSASKRGASTER
jgi:hypothetical protein